MLETPASRHAPSPRRDEAGFSIPPAPKASPTRWVRANETITIAGIAVPGPFYMGVPDRNPRDGFEPSLIDRGLPVAVAGEVFQPARALWVSYTQTFNPYERRGYLLWMASGRTLSVDSRYIFMYFHGLERRVIVDGQRDPNAHEWMPEVVAELHHLKNRYGQEDQALTNAVFCLLYWIEQSGPLARLYQGKDAALHRYAGVRTYTQIAVGQCIADGVPLSARIALTWLLQDGRAFMSPNRRLYKKQFEALFEDLFGAVFSEGLILGPVPARFQLPYRPTSPGLIEHPGLHRELPDVADPMPMISHLAQVKLVFDAAAAEIDRYAKLAAKRPDALGSLDVLSQLPMRLWPAETKEALRELISSASSEDPVMTVGHMVASVDQRAQPSKSTATLMDSILIGVGLTTEPPLVEDGKALKADAHVMLLPLSEAQVPEVLLDGYQLASRFIELACAVLSPGARLHPDLEASLSAQLSSWPEEGLREVPRLGARMRISAAGPLGASAVKKIVDAIPEKERKAAASFVVRVAAVGREPDLAQVKAVGKMYRSCGLDPATVAADLHSVAAGAAVASTTGGFSLDAARIAALRKDTAAVSAMLSSIFTGEADAEPTSAASLTDEADNAGEDQSSGIAGLDKAHSALARHMVMKPCWNREELEVKALELDLMLDAAIERINDLCLDAHDLLLVEGDCTLEIDQELLAQLGWADLEP